MNTPRKPSLAKRMTWMLIVVALVVGGLVGFNVFKGVMIRKFMAQSGIPPATVTTTAVQYQDWRDEMAAVGTLRALRGVDLSTEIAGLVRTVNFKSGQDVKGGDVLVELNADTERAQLAAIKVAVELATTTLARDREQLAAQAVSQATVDNDDADLRAKTAQVAQFQSTLDKKTIRAPFAGRLGISTVNPGQYLNTGDKIVTLQSIDPICVDFYLPQENISRLAKGQAVSLTVDAFPQKDFTGTITAVNPVVDTTTRNVFIEATLRNPGRELLPGMYAKVSIRTGTVNRYLTVPQAAISFNPYGANVFVAKPAPPQTGAAPASGKGGAGGPAPTAVAAQVFVTVGPTRGDQVAILKGIEEGTTIVTSGQLKLKNGTPLVVNNSLLPPDSAHPTPQEK
ncbi:MAG TPA: efflux RND transporter periplasmic adaptor subunit [Burkholderiaceae bacterium]|nr:efflux RND transporter periplasmic adaptor subunit [Burkholderiaceae bacterium]